MCFGGGTTNNYLQDQQARQEALVNQGSQQIDQAFAGYNPAFYDKARSTYLASALPQVKEQYQQAQKGLAFNLANRGLLKSSAGQNLTASLQRQNATNLNNVGNQAVQATQDLQRQISNEKTSLLGQLQNSTNPSQFAQQATEAASGFAAPSIAQPIGNLFSNWANIYMASGLNNQYNSLYGGLQGLNQGRSFSNPLGKTSNFNYDVNK